MFRDPTVFILGAGANAEFGLPLGHELMSAVETNLRVDGRGIAKTESADQFLRLLKNKFGPEAYRDYLDAGKELVQVMGRFPYWMRRCIIFRPMINASSLARPLS